jgi:hypothetical protein
LWQKDWRTKLSNAREISFFYSKAILITFYLLVLLASAMIVATDIVRHRDD